MAEKRKRTRRPKSTSGRVTTPEDIASQRYTPPGTDAYMPSSRWVPFFMFFFFALGVAVILLNYLPGSPGLAQFTELVHLPAPGGNAYLLSGLGLIVVGFIFATRLK